MHQKSIKQQVGSDMLTEMLWLHFARVGQLGQCTVYDSNWCFVDVLANTGAVGGFNSLNKEMWGESIHCTSYYNRYNKNPRFLIITVIIRKVDSLI